MAKIKRWDLNVDGCSYTVTFEFGGLKGTRLLKVNGANIPIEKQHYKALIGVETAMTKNVITYTNDAKAIWNASNGIGTLKSSGSLFIKDVGVRGFYSPSGLIRSFMYQ